MLRQGVRSLRRWLRIGAVFAVGLAVAGCSMQMSRPAIHYDATVAAMAAPNSVARPSGVALPTPPTIVRPSWDPQTAAPQELNWRDHFSSISKGAILVQLDKRRLTYWSPNGEVYREFPIAVPRNADLTRTGRTRIVRKRENPSWRPTPSMLKRNPDLPAYVPPGPDNPLGPRALYLSWTYYAIHGTNSPDSIGRADTSGCFRLFDEHIKWLYENAGVGTPVLVVETLG